MHLLQRKKKIECMNEKEIDALIPGFELKGDPDNCIFMIHGFTGSAPELYPLACLLNEKGYSVVAKGLPGHGTSSLEALRKVGPKDWINAVNEGYEETCKKYKRVFVFGYSMGGDLAIILTKTHKVDGLILCEPALIANSNLGWLAKLLRFTHFKVKWDGPTWEFPDHSEKYWRGQKGYYIKSAADLLTVASKARKQVPNLLCPIMMTWADKDTSIRKEGVDLINEKAPSNIKTYKVYPNNTHHLPSEPEKADFAKDIDIFIKKTVPSK